MTDRNLRYTIAFLLFKPRRVFALAGDAEIAPLLAAYGYDDAARAADLAAAAAAEEAAMAQEKATGEAQRCTVALRVADRTARATFQEFRTICRRLALKGDAASLRVLGLQQPIPRRRDDFVTAARAAYQNAAVTPDILARLRVYGYDEVRLAGALAELDAVTAAQQAREAAYGAQQLATAAQRAALLELEDRYRAFLTLVRLVVKSPQLREKLGVCWSRAVEVSLQARLSSHNEG